MLQCSTGIIVYDCTDSKSAVTSVSLLQSNDCKIEEKNQTISETNVQLIVAKSSRQIKYFSCLVETVTILNHCTSSWFFSRSSVIKRASSIKSISRENCERTVISKRYIDNDHKSVVIDLNNTAKSASFSGIIAGGFNGGSCSGTTFAYQGTVYEKVYVVYDIKITITEDTGILLADENKIMLKSGYQADFKWQESFDSEIGYAFWNSTIENCDNYVVIYEGVAYKSIEYVENGDQIITYSQVNQSSNRLFMIQVTEKLTSCDLEIWSTKNSLLFVNEIKGQEPFKLKYNQNISEGININLYNDFKLDTTYKNIMINMKAMFAHLKYKQCLTDQAIVNNKLAGAMNAGAEGGFELMGEPGYAIRRAGMVLYIIKCERQTAVFRHEETCALELPVTYNGKKYYMNSRTRILQEFPNSHDCNEVAPAMFYIENTWFALRQSTLIRNEPPPKFELAKIEEFKFTELSDLENRGLFTQRQLAKNKASILYSIHKDALSANLMRALQNKSELNANMSFVHGLTLNDIRKLKDEYFADVYDVIKSKVMTIGNIMSFIVGTIYIVTFINEIIFRAIILRIAFGCSAKIFAACCASISTAMLSKTDIRLAREKRDKKKMEKLTQKKMPDGTIHQRNYDFAEPMCDRERNCVEIKHEKYHPSLYYPTETDHQIIQNKL